LSSSRLTEQNEYQYQGDLFHSFRIEKV
jgi:hypothetical protein